MFPVRLPVHAPCRPALQRMVGLWQAVLVDMLQRPTGQYVAHPARNSVRCTQSHSATKPAALMPLLAEGSIEVCADARRRCPNLPQRRVEMPVQTGPNYSRPRASVHPPS